MPENDGARGRDYRMRDLVSHAIDHYHLADHYREGDGRAAIEKSIRRAVAAMNEARRGNRIARDGKGYAFTRGDMEELVETRLFEYFLHMAPPERAEELRCERRVRQEAEWRGSHRGEVLEEMGRRAQEAADSPIPPVPRDAMDRAAIMAMLALLVEKAYDGRRFDFGKFGEDYVDLWELDGLVEFDDPVGNLRIEQLRAKLGDPKRYLTPPAE